MQEGGFHQTRSVSPTRLAIVVALHGAAIGALALSKMEVIPGVTFDPTEVINIPLPAPPPPPEPQPQPDTRAPQRSQVDTVDPVIPSPPSDFTVTQPRQDTVPFNTGPIGEADPRPEPEIILPPPPPPPPLPVRVEARLRSGDLQPPYPASEERLGNEGKVVVRVTVGTDGRVKAVERVSATSDAFFRSTERHALRAWRFVPASEDGRPVESRKTMTLTFRLND